MNELCKEYYEQLLNWSEIVRIMTIFKISQSMKWHSVGQDKLYYNKTSLYCYIKQ